MTSLVSCRPFEMSVDDRELWYSLQLCDSSFPNGAFAHSAGLESALFHSLIVVNDGNDHSSLIKFIHISLENSTYYALPIGTKSFLYTEMDVLTHSHSMYLLTHSHSMDLLTHSHPIDSQTII